MDLKIYLNHLGMLCASESKREQARAGGIFVGVFSSKASNYFSDKGRDLEKVVRGDWFERRYREN